MIRKLILGPPGTGKTQTLLNIVEQALDSGIRPQEIAYLAFTRVAAEEAVTRASKTFNLNPNDFIYFRTLHSLAYRLLGLKRNEVMQAQHYAEFAQENGWELSQAYDEEGPSTGNALGDQLLRCYQLARARMTSMAEEWSRGEYDFPDWAAKRFEESLRAFKKELNLMDFADFLDACEIRQPLRVRIFIVDEAQDLTPQQWAFVSRAAVGVPAIYVAGDDDQAIYEWAGANVTRFLHLEEFEREVLPVSHRLPQNFKEFAEKIVLPIKERYAKDWSGNPGRGRGVLVFTGPQHVEVGRVPGELALARTSAGAGVLERMYREAGVHYSYRGKSSVDPRTVEAIRTFSALGAGKEVPLFSVNLFNGIMNRLPRLQVSGDPKWLRFEDFIWPFEGRPPWYEAFTGLSAPTRAAYRALLRRGDRLDGSTAARIATIHTAKGAQAARVLLMAQPASKSEVYGPQERRVWYVGATRASEEMVIIDPERNPLFRR